MKSHTLYEKPLSSGYKIKITFTKGGPLVVLLENKNGEHLGSRFTTLKKLASDFSMFTNTVIELTSKQISEVKDRIKKIDPSLVKSESTKISTCLSELDIINQKLEKFLEV